MAEWKPIETAPEMTDILVYSSDRRQAVAYCCLLYTSPSPRD